jgi:hypothetical protein
VNIIDSNFKNADFYFSSLLHFEMQKDVLKISNIEKLI